MEEFFIKILAFYTILLVIVKLIKDATGGKKDISYIASKWSIYFGILMCILILLGI
ncbi:hypothetical protein [Persephonella sp.]